MDEESYFKIQYESGERVAAVRGTVFDLNLVDGYLFTESHAVEVTNEKGWLITTLPQGKWITIPKKPNEEEVEIFSRTSKDWIQSNSELDTILWAERAKKLQEAIERLKNDTYLEKIQNWLRSIFWLKERIPPYSITLTNWGISISIDTEKLSTKDKESLEQIYSELTWLQSKIETIQSKQKLEEALLWLTQEGAKEKYNEWFTRSNLYDSWELAKELKEKEGGKAEELYKNAREKLNGYSKIETIKDDIDRLEDALPENMKESIKKNNSWILDASSDIIDTIGNSINNTSNIIIDTWIQSTEAISDWIQSLINGKK